MAKIIYKYRLEIKDFQEIEMPFASKIIKVSAVKVYKIGYPHPDIDEINLWCVCPVDSIIVKRGFVLVPAGKDFDDKDLKYIDSFILQKTNLMFHLFDKM